MFLKTGVLKTFAKFQRKHLKSQINGVPGVRLIPAQVFSCELIEILRVFFL